MIVQRQSHLHGPGVYRAHMCDLSSGETEVGRSPGRSQPGPCSETKPSSVRKESSVIVEAERPSAGISQGALQKGLELSYP